MGSLRDLVLTVFILGLLPAVLARPWWGILLWTWVGLMNPHKMTWGFAYNFPFAMIIAIVTLVAVFISREPKKLPLTPPVVLLIFFILWMTVTTILYALYPDLAWIKWEKVIKIQAFIFLTLMVMQSEQRIRALVLVATLSIAFFGIKGGIYTIAQGRRRHGARPGRRIHLREHRDRAGAGGHAAPDALAAAANRAALAAHRRDRLHDPHRGLDPRARIRAADCSRCSPWRSSSG